MSAKSVEQEVVEQIDVKVEMGYTPDQAITMQLVIELSKIGDTLNIIRKSLRRR